MENLTFKEWLQLEEQIFEENVKEILTEEIYLEVAPILAIGGIALRGVISLIIGLVRAGTIGFRIGQALVMGMIRLVKIVGPTAIKAVIKLFEILHTLIKIGVFTGRVVLKIIKVITKYAVSHGIPFVRIAARILGHIVKQGWNLTSKVIMNTLRLISDIMEGQDVEEVKQKAEREDIPVKVMKAIDNAMGIAFTGEPTHV